MKPSSFRSAANVRVSAQSTTQFMLSTHRSFRPCKISIWLRMAHRTGHDP